MTVYQLHPEGCERCAIELKLGGKDDDVAYITGFVTVDDADTLVEIREKHDKVVAYGTCATHGGIFGLANQRGAYVVPVDRVISVDEKVLGCPPRGSGDVLCRMCERVREGKLVESFYRLNHTPPQEVCFNEAGFVCSGGLSLDCAPRGERCIDFGLPCRGCVPLSDDQGAKLIDEVGSLALKVEVDTVATDWGTDMLGPRPDDLTRSFPDLVGTFFRFTLASAPVNRGVKESTGDLYADVFVGRLAEEAVYIASRIFGVRGVSAALNLIEALEEIFGIEVSDTTKQIREELRSHGRALADAAEAMDSGRYEQVKQDIIRIGGDINLSNVAIGGFRRPIEGYSDFDAYRADSFEFKAGESEVRDAVVCEPTGALSCEMRDALTRIKVSVDNDGVIVGWESEVL